MGSRDWLAARSTGTAAGRGTDRMQAEQVQAGQMQAEQVQVGQSDQAGG